MERRPHLITLVGPPGIGKSRLCREIAALVASDGGRILRGRCLPYEEQAGYQAFSLLVHEAGGILASDSPNVAREKLQRAVERLLPQDEAAETLRYLALLLGLAPDDGVSQARLLFFAARRFIECAGRGKQLKSGQRQPLHSRASKDLRSGWGEELSIGAGC